MCDFRHSPTLPPYDFAGTPPVIYEPEVGWSGSVIQVPPVSKGIPKNCTEPAVFSGHGKNQQYEATEKAIWPTCGASSARCADQGFCMFFGKKRLLALVCFATAHQILALRMRKHNGSQNLCASVGRT